MNYNDQSGEVSSLAITGGATFVTATEAAESDAASYDIENGVLILTGNVLLTQGASAFSADRMQVDLESGSARLDGNVSVVFTQGDN